MPVSELASYRCGRSSNPGVENPSVLEFVVALYFAPRGFSTGFPSPQKTTFPDSNSIRSVCRRRTDFVDVLPLNRYILIYLSIYFLIYLFVLGIGKRRN